MKVGVIGMGTMGGGIAQQFSASGFDVVIKGRTQASLDKGKAGMEKRLARSVEKGRLSEEDCAAQLGRVHYVKDMKDLADCDLIVECIREDIPSKQELFNELNELDLKDTIIATNTSSLSITELAMQYKYPEKVIGMHFFNPVPVMKLVEVIQGVTTAEEVNQKIVEISKQLGKTPVEVQEAPGFVVNRILIPMVNEAVGIYAEGIASAEDIDTAMKLGANHPMGPLELGDLIGLDVCLSVMDVLYDEFGDSKYRAHTLLRKMVRGNKLGRKTKQGFYKY
jgi:3-hydroxybutyryl-CoA dehydrogenase